MSLAKCKCTAEQLHGTARLRSQPNFFTYINCSADIRIKKQLRTIPTGYSLSSVHFHYSCSTHRLRVASQLALQRCAPCPHRRVVVQSRYQLTARLSLAHAYPSPCCPNTTNGPMSLSPVVSLLRPVSTCLGPQSLLPINSRIHSMRHFLPSLCDRVTK